MWSVKIIAIFSVFLWLFSRQIDDDMSVIRIELQRYPTWFFQKKMELKVWVEGIQRIVCGVTDKTTCQVRQQQKKLFLKKFWIFPPIFFWPKKKEVDDIWNFPCDQFIQRSSLIEGFFIFPVKLSLHFCIYIVSNCMNLQNREKKFMLIKINMLWRCHDRVQSLQCMFFKRVQ